MKERIAMPVIFSAAAAFSSSWATALDENYHDYCDYCDYCDYLDYLVPQPWTKIILHFPAHCVYSCLNRPFAFELFYANLGSNANFFAAKSTLVLIN